MPLPYYSESNNQATLYTYNSATLSGLFISNSMNLSLLNSQGLIWSRDNDVKVGHILRDSVVAYNDDYGVNHPYVPFSQYGDYIVYAGTFERSPNTVTPYFVQNGPLAAYQLNGLGYTSADTLHSVANLETSTAINLSDDDRGLSDYANVIEKYEHGTFVIGPQAAYNNVSIIPTKQYAYWVGQSPTNYLTRSHLSFEESGVISFSYRGNTATVPRVWDDKRSSWHTPNGIFSSSPLITRLSAWEVDTDYSKSQTATRALSFTQPTYPNSGGLRHRYNLGDLSLTNTSGQFSMYMRFMVSGISPDTNTVTLFQNHSFKANLENNNGDNDFQLVLYTKNQVDSSYRNGLPENWDRDYGFEPDPAGKVVDRSLQVGLGNVIYEWFGSNPELKAELNSSAYYASQKFAFGGFSRGDIQCLERTESTVSDKGKGILSSVSYDPELVTWYNAAYRFPERIKLGQSTTVIVSYDGAGHPVRRDKLANLLRHPYNSGVSTYIPTLSVMYGPINKDLSEELYGYGTIHNEISPDPYRAHEAKSYASYDLNFVGVRPCQTLASALTDSKANDLIYGYRQSDYFASGYIGDSYFIGAVEEFGYSDTFLSAGVRKDLLDSTFNLSNIVSRSYGAFANVSGDFGDDFGPDFNVTSTKFVRFATSSGNVTANTSVGGVWDRGSWGDPTSYYVSSSMYFHVTDYPGREEYYLDPDYLPYLNPFPADEDLVLKIAARHVGKVAPTIYFDVVDRPYETTDYRPTSLANASTKWTSDRKQMSISGDISCFLLSGRFDGGGGSWNFKDKSVRMTAEYPGSLSPFDSEIDVFAINLQVAAYKASTTLNSGVNLYTAGSSYTTLPSGLDLYLGCDSMVKTLDLYLASSLPTSGRMDLVTYGSSSGYSGYTQMMNLYTYGKTSLTSGIDLYMPDPNFIPSRTITMFIGDSYVWVAKSGIMTLFTEGLMSSPSGKAAELYLCGTSQFGNADPQYILPLYLSAVPTATNPDNIMPLYINGANAGLVNTMDLYLGNAWTSSNSSLNLYIRREGMDGGYPYSGSMPLYIERTESTARDMTLYTLAHQSPSSGLFDLYMSGTNTVSTGSMTLYLGHRDTQSMTLYTRGFA